MRRKERIDRGIKVRSDDIYAIASYREMLYLLLPRLTPVIALLILPLITQFCKAYYYEKVAVLSCIIGLLALSWDYMASVGLFSLGQAFFFGTGAYFSAYAHLKYGLHPIFAMVIATVAGALFCTAILAPVLRLRGVYFSIITLALPLFFTRIIEATKILGGTEGLTGLMPISNRWAEVYIPIVSFLTALFAFRRIINSDYGLVIQAIRDNDRAVLASGLNVQLYKAQCVFVASIASCFAGAFMAHFYQAVGLSAFALDYSLMPLTSAILGGVGTFAGPAIGAFVIVPLSETLRTLGTLRVVVYAVLLFVAVIALPEGIFPYIRRKYQQVERIVEV